MKKLAISLLCLAAGVASMCAQNDPIHIDELHARDPFIHVDHNTQEYYLHTNTWPSISAFKSKDLKSWEPIGNSFEPASDFWGTKDFWAPDMYYYKGKYYLFVTFSSNTHKRGTSVLVADNPGGPYQPLVNESVTPTNWMCLDASLYVDDDNRPWMLYCREWLEVGDGEIYAQQLHEDLTHTIGEPVLLFKASQAPWVGEHDIDCYVTDAPIIHRTKDGALLMTWSSFTKENKYAIGTAYSDNGKLTGKWIHNPHPLNADDGGHAMIFTDLDGYLRISYHAPNINKPHVKLLWLEEAHNNLVIKEAP